jgi:hypothetical protein
LLRHGGGNRGIHLLNLRDRPTRWSAEVKRRHSSAGRAADL